MRVSVLVAAYNAGSFLARCLDSLVAQTHADVETIVIDDASTDNTAEVAGRYPGVKLLRMPVNRGQAVARNEGIKVATGELMTMVDADDWLSPDALELAVREFEADKEVDSVLLRLLKVYADGREEDYVIPKGPWTGGEAFRLSLDWTLHGLYVTRSALYRQYPFDTATRLFSDDNTTRLHFFASRKVVACHGTYFYWQHAESMTNSHTMLRFDYMEANLSMRKWLDRIHASDDDIRHYEAHRWLNYIGMRWYQHRHRFPESLVKPRFASIYRTFSPNDIPLAVRSKFGYRWFGCYRMFVLQEWLYFWLRTIKDCVCAWLTRGDKARQKE